MVYAADLLIACNLCSSKPAPRDRENDHFSVVKPWLSHSVFHRCVRGVTVSAMKRATILDCYTVEPAGLGVPPYLSSYVRYAYHSLRATNSFEDIRYITIDDFRQATGRHNADARKLGYTDRLTYSTTRNCNQTLDLLSSSDVVIVIAGDAVPSVHLHAENGSIGEIGEVLQYIHGKVLALGPAAAYLRSPSHPLNGRFTAFHNQTILPSNIFEGSNRPITYLQLDGLIDSYEPLLSQIPWPVIAEMDLYRGCTRRSLCDFCNEPAKNPLVLFRSPEHVIREIGLLYDAGVRHFRLGQQACFFSYFNRDITKISELLEGIRNRCCDLKVLHIDNVDPLAAASPNGRAIARLVTTYCTEGNCAPMGIESFDMAVVQANNLTCTPDVLLRAIANIEETGAEFGPSGQRKLLAGLNIIYGLPAETRRTHFENMQWLVKIFDDGHYCHRTNVRQVNVYPGTPLASQTLESSVTFDEDFRSWKRDIGELYDRPMKERVYPNGQALYGLHSFFVNEQGTWFRKLGSYPIMVIEPEIMLPLYEERDMVVTSHAGRHIYGRKLDS